MKYFSTFSLWLIYFSIGYFKVYCLIFQNIGTLWLSFYYGFLTFQLCYENRLCNFSTIYLKVCYIGKLSSGHKTRKGQFSFQSQRRTMSKNVPTSTQLCLFRSLAKLCSKFFKVGCRGTWTEKYQCTSWVSKGRRNQRSNCQHSLVMEKVREFSENFLFQFHWLC